MLGGIEVWRTKWLIHDVVAGVHESFENFARFVDRRRLQTCGVVEEIARQMVFLK